MAKRKTLPSDFEETLTHASLDDLKAVFDRCLLDARGGFSKHTAIGFVECPDELIVWLVQQGLDVDAADSYGTTPLMERASLGRSDQISLLVSLGADVQAVRQRGETPLHAAAGGQRAEAVRALLENGADPKAVNDSGETPLLYGLRRTANTGIARMADTAKLLLEAGDSATPEARRAVEQIGETFEFHRDGFSSDLLSEVDDGLTRLYEMFEVAPVGARVSHDGASPIHVPKGEWRQQFQQLWELLVPSQGAAKTAQGEAIRIAARVSQEIVKNGGANWDSDFKRMLASLPEHFASGNPLSADEIEETRGLARELRGGDGEPRQTARLGELAVAWVTANPEPMSLATVPYSR